MRYAIQLFRLLFRSAQRLFHMLVGLVFLVLAVGGVSVSYSEWRYHSNTPSVAFLMCAGFTVGLVVFGLYSFAKARSVR